MTDSFDVQPTYHIELREIYRALQLAQHIGEDDKLLCRLASNGCSVIHKLELKETPFPVNHSWCYKDYRCPNCNLPVSRKEDVNYCGTCGQRLAW